MQNDMIMFKLYNQDSTWANTVKGDHLLFMSGFCIMREALPTEHE